MVFLVDAKQDSKVSYFIYYFVAVFICQNAIKSFRFELCVWMWSGYKVDKKQYTNTLWDIVGILISCMFALCIYGSVPVVMQEASKKNKQTKTAK